MEALDDEDLLEMVDVGLSARGPWSTTTRPASGQRALPNLTLRDDLVLRSGGEIAWAFRKNSPQLAASLASFAAATAKGTTFGNLVTGRYLVADEQLRCATTRRDRSAFSSSMATFRRYGASTIASTSCCWRRRATRNPGSTRRRAARPVPSESCRSGPRTARDPNVDVAGIDQVENNIHAAAKYLRHLIDTVFADPAIAEFDRMLLALAAYNAGPAKIARPAPRARRGAASIRTAGSAMSSWPSATSAARRSHYVGNILKYYTVYRGITEQEEARRAARSLIVAR